jgi:hypothetical protein
VIGFETVDNGIGHWRVKKLDEATSALLIDLLPYTKWRNLALERPHEHLSPQLRHPHIFQPNRRTLPDADRNPAAIFSSRAKGIIQPMGKWR